MTTTEHPMNAAQPAHRPSPEERRATLAALRSAQTAASAQHSPEGQPHTSTPAPSRARSGAAGRAWLAFGVGAAAGVGLLGGLGAANASATPQEPPVVVHRILLEQPAVSPTTGAPSTEALGTAAPPRESQVARVVSEVAAPVVTASEGS